MIEMIENMKISKMPAVESQLREAIALHFQHRNPIAIHTLACAASQIMADLAKHGGVYSLIRGADMIKPEFRKMYLKALKQPENFFKHADRDPDETLDFDPTLSEHVIFEACDLYRKLRGKMLFEGFIFSIWYAMKYPNILLEGELKRVLISAADSEKLSSSDFELFGSLLMQRDAFASVTNHFV